MTKLVDKWYCSKCFLGLIDQKLKQNLRRYKIKKNSRLLVSDKASEYVIREVINLPVQIVTGKLKHDYVVLPWTMDDENEEFFLRLADNNGLSVKDDDKVIKLFYPMSKMDMKTYLLLKKVKHNFEKTEVNSMLDKLEAKYPGTKTALLKSEEKLRQILR
ncbi:MAG: hypothetical protein V1729_03280 [Candidatus Woesearchaeota archaeon]